MFKLWLMRNVRHFSRTGMQHTRRKLSYLGKDVVASEINIDSPQNTFLEHGRSLASLNMQPHYILASSNDVTWSCKEFFGFVHRSRSKLDHESLQNMSNLSVIRATHIYDLVVMLEELDIKYLFKFREYYRSAMEEFVGAVTFFNYCKSGIILNIQDVNKMMMELSVSKYPIQVTLEDYLMGLLDLTGELMILAITLIGRGEHHSSHEIHQTIAIICDHLTVTINDENMLDIKKELGLKLEGAIKNRDIVSNALRD